MPESAVAPLLAHLRREPSRTWSLIVTLYGDAIAPRGGQLWLGTLLQIFAAMGIAGNVVRTAMSRLAADGLLERSRAGRNSYYRLDEKGRAGFAAAEQRIYAAHRPGWDGAFRLAILDGEDPAPARTLLEAAGYALLSPGVLVAASDPGSAPPAGAILLRALAGEDEARRLAARVWPASRLDDSYRRFLDVFGPWASLLDAGGPLPDLDALVCRLLLIHEYRRIVLRDPMLPDALLPGGWAGHPARTLCARLYALLLPASERWLDGNALDENGPLPPAAPSLGGRFHD